jgi:hypothetical protein
LDHPVILQRHGSGGGEVLRVKAFPHWQADAPPRGAVKGTSKNRVFLEVPFILKASGNVYGLTYEKASKLGRY